MRRRLKWRKASKRDLKKHLRRREAELNKWLRRCVVEPVRVRMRAARIRRRNASYKIEFGRGSTYLKIKGG